MAMASQYSMDPRHPELAVTRLKELVAQYDRIESDMKKANVASRLAQLEREGGLVVQEICLVAPRIHEAMMQTSRQRRRDLSRGNIYDQMREYAATAERVDEPVEMPHDGYLSVDETIEEIPAPPNQAETVIVEPKPRKKKTAKKANKK